jgi:hypothetical protein
MASLPLQLKTNNVLQLRASLSSWIAFRTAPITHARTNSRARVRLECRLHSFRLPGTGAALQTLPY